MKVSVYRQVPGIAHIKDIAGDLLLSVGETVEGIVLRLLAILDLHAQHNADYTVGKI